jgi:hypothetical protein
MYLSEAGTSSSFEVVLNSQPTASVTISVSSSDTTAGTVSTGLLTFTTGSWSTPQTVTVTGVDDTLEDGNQAFTVDLSASSADTDYDLLTPAPLAFETVDDDIAGVTVDIDDGLVTTETGATDTFQIVLNSEPTNSVDISLTSLDTGEATINPIGVSFSTANWFLPVTFTVTGVDDFAVDGTQPAVIDLGTVSSLDGNYNGMMPDDVTVYNVDDDSLKQVVVLANPKGYFTSENGASTQIAVVLSEQPTANVNLGPLSSTDATEGSVSPPSLTFTPADWNIPHMVTVTGVVDGGKGDGKVFYDVDLGITSSTDLLFDGIAGGSVTVTSIDSMFIDEYVWIPPTPAPFNSIGPSGSATGIPIMFREVDFQDGYVAEDEGYEVIPIGFTFYYMGWPCEQIMVFTNGFATFNMYLNTASFWNDALILSSASAPPAPDADLFIDILSPWWDDLHMGLVPGTVYFETSGIMPNRVLTIEWEDARYAVTSSNTYNFQIKLYEYSNRIEFCYGPYSGGPPNNTTASVGIKDDIGGDGHFIDGLNGAMVEAGSSFDYDYPDFPTNSMGGDVFIGFDPTL